MYFLYKFIMRTYIYLYIHSYTSTHIFISRLKITIIQVISIILGRNFIYLRCSNYEIKIILQKKKKLYEFIRAYTSIVHLKI